MIQGAYLWRNYKNNPLKFIFIEEPQYVSDNNYEIASMIYYLYKWNIFKILYIHAKDDIKFSKIFLNKYTYISFIKTVCKNILYSVVELTVTSVWILKWMYIFVSEKNYQIFIYKHIQHKKQLKRIYREEGIWYTNPVPNLFNIKCISHLNKNRHFTEIENARLSKPLIEMDLLMEGYISDKNKDDNFIQMAMMKQSFIIDNQEVKLNHPAFIKNFFEKKYDNNPVYLSDLLKYYDYNKYNDESQLIGTIAHEKLSGIFQNTNPYMITGKIKYYDTSTVATKIIKGEIADQIAGNNFKLYERPYQGNQENIFLQNNLEINKKLIKDYRTLNKLVLEFKSVCKELDIDEDVAEKIINLKLGLHFDLLKNIPTSNENILVIDYIKKQQNLLDIISKTQINNELKTIIDEIYTKAYQELMEGLD